MLSERGPKKLQLCKRSSLTEGRCCIFQSNYRSCALGTINTFSLHTNWSSRQLQEHQVQAWGKTESVWSSRSYGHNNLISLFLPQQINCCEAFEEYAILQAAYLLYTQSVTSLLQEKLRTKNTFWHLRTCYYTELLLSEQAGGLLLSYWVMAW